MKTYDEFENALLNGESFCVVDGRGVIFNFYACSKSDLCGLVTVCVETVVVFDSAFKGIFESSAVVPAMKAFYVYEKFIKLA